MAGFSNNLIPYDNLDEQQENTRRLISQLPPPQHLNREDTRAPSLKGTRQTFMTSWIMAAGLRTTQSAVFSGQQNASTPLEHWTPQQREDLARLTRKPGHAEKVLADGEKIEEKIACKEGDKNCEENCYKIVKYKYDRTIIKTITEKTLYDDGVIRNIPPNNECYSCDKLNRLLRYLLLEGQGQGRVDLNKAISDGVIDVNKLNKSLCARDEFKIDTEGFYEFSYQLTTPMNTGNGNSVSYFFPCN